MAVIQEQYETQMDPIIRWGEWGGVVQPCYYKGECGNYNIEDTTDFMFYVPRIDPHFTPSLTVVPVQLMGYYISVAWGLDVDKSRNLAQSVPVE